MWNTELAEFTDTRFRLFVMLETHASVKAKYRNRVVKRDCARRSKHRYLVRCPLKPLLPIKMCEVKLYPRGSFLVLRSAAFAGPISSLDSGFKRLSLSLLARYVATD